MKHYVITRLALKLDAKWRKRTTGLDWDEWVKDSIQLMDKYCRPSLKNQSDQDFTLLSLVDPSVTDVGTPLDNEVIIRFNFKNQNSIINAINGAIDDPDWVIITRLDRDDCLRYDFIEKVKQYLSDEKEAYVDIKKMISYDAINNAAYDSPKYNRCVSPFVSVREKVNGRIRCIPFAVNHSQVNRKLPGRKVTDLIPVQVVHGTNVTNKVAGGRCEFNKSEFGL